MKTFSGFGIAYRNSRLNIRTTYQSLFYSQLQHSNHATEGKLNSTVYTEVFHYKNRIILPVLPTPLLASK